MNTVLHIDDNEYNRDLMRRYLQKMGLQVLEAVDGFSGLKIALETPVDLILLDINLPDIDGFGVLRRLKRTEETANIKVVAVTANTMNGDRTQCLNAGFDAYLSKPIVRAELTILLRRYLPQSLEGKV
jgi:two-component system, cell cycle response regulator DivK